DAATASLNREIRIAIGRLPETLRKQLCSVDFSGELETAKLLSPILQTGFERLGIQVTPGNSPLLSAEPAAVLAANRYLAKQPIAFEFVVAEPTRWELLLKRFEKKHNRMIAAATAAVIILPLLIFSIRGHIESSLEADWNGMRNEVSKLETLQNNIRRFHP